MSVERLPRLSSNEVNKVVNDIPVLRDLFRNKNNVKQSLHQPEDITDGFLYSSRFHKLESLIETVKQNESDGTKQQNNNNKEELTSSNVNNAVNDNTLHKEQKRKFAVAMASLAIKPYKRLTIVKNGGLGTLSDLSIINDHFIQKCCAITFYLLSKEQNIRLIMIDSNIIPSIVTLLNNSTNNQIKYNCCKAICNICNEFNSEIKTIRESIITILSNVITFYPNMLEIALKILLNLSCVNEKYSRIEEINEIVIYIYDIIVKKYMSNTSYQLLLLSILCNLSSIKGNQQKLIEDGCIYILDLSFKSNNPLMKQLGSDIIRNLTYDNRSRLKLLDNNILNNIIIMANDSIDSIRISAIKSVYILCKDNISRHKLLSNVNIIQVLILLSYIKYNNIDISKLILKIWRILCKDKLFIIQILNHGLVDALKTILVNNLNELSIHRHCCECICILLSLCYDINTDVISKSMSSIDNNNGNEHILSIQLLIKLGALDIIITLSNQNISYLNSNNIDSNSKIILKDEKIVLDMQTCEWCSYACYLLSQSSDLQTELIQDGLLPSLINLITITPIHTIHSNISTARNQPVIVKDKKIRTKTICSAALVNITLLSHIDSSIAIPICISILQQLDIDKLTKINCVTCLYNLAYNDNNCKLMLQSGALLPIVQLTQSVSLSTTLSTSMTNLSNINRRNSLLLVKMDKAVDNETEALQMKMRCAAILSRLSKYHSYYHLFNTNDVLDILLHLSNNVTDLITQRRVVTTLSNLSTNRILRKKLLSLNPIQYVMSLAQKRDEHLWRGCVTIICNLSYENGSEHYLVSQGIVHTLLITALINTDSILTKIICVKALSNLLALHEEIDINETIYKTNPEISNTVVRNNISMVLEEEENNIKPDEIISEKVIVSPKIKSDDDYDEDYEDDYDEEFESNSRPTSSLSAKHPSNRSLSVTLNKQLNTIKETNSPTNDICNNDNKLSNNISNLSLDNLLDEAEIDVNIPIVSPRSKIYIYNTMVTEGLIWGISSLALLDDLELLTICAKILFKLSIDYSKEMIASSMTIKAIGKILNYEMNAMSNIELQRLGSSILINLLIYTNQNNNDLMFYNNIVEYMKKIVLSNDMIVIESCILSLCLISQSDKCRKTIVSSGMINLLDTGYSNIDSKVVTKVDNNNSSLYLTEVNESSIEQTNPINQNKLSNIFNNHITSLAYLTMYGNIAKDKELSINLIDDKTLSRFRMIIDTNQRQLDFTILRAIYYLSCYNDNISKLCNHKVYSIVYLLQLIWDHTISDTSQYKSKASTPSGGSKYLSSQLDKVLGSNYSLYIEYFIAIIYNLSTNQSTQSVLVVQGIVKLIVTVFPYIIEYTNYLLDLHPMNKPVLKSFQSITNLLSNNPSIRHNQSSKFTVSSLPNSPTNININSNLANHMKSISLLFNSLVHIGCGNINTNIYCNELLHSNMFLYILSLKSYFSTSNTGPHDTNNYSMVYLNISLSNYLFDPMLYLRCSCTIRNILINQSNHTNFLHLSNYDSNYSNKLLYGIIDLYNITSKLNVEENLAINLTSNSTAGSNINNSTTSNTTNNLPYYLNTYPSINQNIDPNVYTMDYITKSIKKNCISILKSLSYNSSLHESLKSTNAINILLLDMKYDMTDDEVLLSKLTNPLLLEVEAESWSNGIRGITKEKKCLPIDSSNSYVELIDNNTNIVTTLSTNSTVDTSTNNIENILKLHVNIRYIQLYKYQILLEDQLLFSNPSPTMLHSNSESTNKSINTLDQSITEIDLDSKAIININLKDLDIIDDNTVDDIIVVVPKQCPKLLYNESIIKKLKSIHSNIDSNINMDSNSDIIQQLNMKISTDFVLSGSLDSNSISKSDSKVDSKVLNEDNKSLDGTGSYDDDDNEEKILTYLKLIDDEDVEIIDSTISNDLDSNTSKISDRTTDRSIEKLPIISNIPMYVSNNPSDEYFSINSSEKFSIYDKQKKKYFNIKKKKDRKFNQLIKLIKNTSPSSNEINDVDKILKEWKSLSGR